MKAGLDASFFTIDERRALSFTNPPNFEAQADSGRDNVYDVTVQSKGRRLQYRLPSCDRNRDRRERGAGGLERQRQLAWSFQENRGPGPSAVKLLSAVDPEGAGITGWSLSGTDGGDFTISENGELTFRNTPNYEGPAGLQPGQRVPGLRQGLRREILRLLQRNGDRGGRQRTAGHQHRQPDRVHLPGERDLLPLHLPGRRPGAGGITWSVSGTDGDDFAASGTGVLSFRTPPNYEIPADSDRDNEYEVTMVASDSGGLQGTLPVTVTVTDVNEGPEISGQQSLSFNENRAHGAGPGLLHRDRPRRPVRGHNALEPFGHRRR